MKTITNKKIAMFCLADFATGIFTGMIANYLVYFFQPATDKTGITPYITQGLIFLGVLTFLGIAKAIGHIIDAFTDPLVANWSDKCRSKRGRRIPFMQWSAIPYGLSALLIFCPPINGIHWINNVWVAVFMFLYFFFYTTYMIPQRALFPELITDHKKRLTAYSISSFFFVTGSALVYMAPLFVSMFMDIGCTANLSYQLTFAVLTVIGIALLLVSAFSIKEKEYVDSVRPSIKMTTALKQAFSNSHFRIATFGQLFQTISMAFFQATIMYYVTVLLGLSQSLAPIILGVSIVTSIALYPLILKVSRKTGKRFPLLIALVVFILSYLAIYFLYDLPFNKLVMGIVFAVVVSYPFAALNILPNAIMSDVIQYDTIKSGVNKEGIYSAARSFITKMGQSLAIMIVPSVLAVGAMANSSVGIDGVRLTALVSAGFCVISVIFFMLYKDKNVTDFIENSKEDKPMTEREREYAEKLSKMIQFKTVSHSDDINIGEMYALKDYLKSQFPNVAKLGEWQDLNGGLFIKVAGKSGEKPLALMSHLDVVDALGDWEKPAFSGEISAGFVHGRGAVDTKTSLLAIFAAVDEVLEQGEPPQDLYIISSSREEIAGKDAETAVQIFKTNGVKPYLLVDEGGAVLKNPIGGVHGEFAMIAMSERSSCRVVVESEEKRLLKLAKKLKRYKASKRAFAPEIDRMFELMLPKMSLYMRIIFKRFKRQLLWLLPKLSKEALAMIGATVSYKIDNGKMTITLASTYYHGIEECRERLIKYLAELGFTAKALELRQCPIPEPLGSYGYELVARTAEQTFEGVTPVPFIIFGGTDARHFVGTAGSVIRFAPLKITNAELKTVHKENEKITIEAIEKAVLFYKNLILNI